MKQLPKKQAIALSAVQQLIRLAAVFDIKQMKQWLIQVIDKEKRSVHINERRGTQYTLMLCLTLGWV